MVVRRTYVAARLDTQPAMIGSYSTSSERSKNCSSYLAIQRAPSLSRRRTLNTFIVSLLYAFFFLSYDRMKRGADQKSKRRRKREREAQRMPLLLSPQKSLAKKSPALCDVETLSLRDSSFYRFYNFNLIKASYKQLLPDQICLIHKTCRNMHDVGQAQCVITDVYACSMHSSNRSLSSQQSTKNSCNQLTSCAYASMATWKNMYHNTIYTYI